MITGSQLRAARALLDWRQEQLSTASGVAEQTIRLFENGRRSPHRSTIDQLQTALEAAGIAFLRSETGVGVMLNEGDT